MPPCLAGWANGDVERRYANRRSHFAAIAAGGDYNAYDALCKDPALFLDSYFQVGARCYVWHRAKQQGCGCSFSKASRSHHCRNAPRTGQP